MFNCWCCYCCCCCQYTQNIFDIRERCLSNRKSVQSIMRGIKFDSTFLYNALFCFFVPPVCVSTTFHLRLGPSSVSVLTFQQPFLRASLSLFYSPLFSFSLYFSLFLDSLLSLSLSLSLSIYTAVKYSKRRRVSRVYMYASRLDAYVCIFSPSLSLFLPLTSTHILSWIVYIYISLSFFTS